MTSLVLRRLDPEVNKAYVGLNGELVAVPGQGLALHNGATPGGAEIRAASAIAANILRNGNFIVQQRGSSWPAAPSSGNYQHIVDGWWINRGGTSVANCAVARTYTDTLLEAYSALRLTLTSGNTAASFYALCQQIADCRLLQGRTVTLSGIGRATTVKRIAITVRQEFNSATAPVETFGGNIELQATWAPFELTFTVPKVAADAVVNPGHYTSLWLWLEAGSNYDARTGGIGNQSASFDFANLKLEVGQRATPFGPISDADERAAVQRYYEVNTETVFLSQQAVEDIDTKLGTAYLQYREKKTKTPTITNVTFTNVASVSTTGIGTQGFNVTCPSPNAGTTTVARVTGFTADAEYPPFL